MAKEQEHAIEKSKPASINSAGVDDSELTDRDLLRVAGGVETGPVGAANTRSMPPEGAPATQASIAMMQACNTHACDEPGS